MMLSCAGVFRFCPLPGRSSRCSLRAIILGQTSHFMHAFRLQGMFPMRSLRSVPVLVSAARFRSSISKFPSEPFYHVSSSANPAVSTPLETTLGSTIRGEVIDNAVDIKKVRPGEKIEVPYEVTVSHSLRDFWQSAFYSHDRINTSTPFARTLGLQDQVVPFSLMLFLAGSMSHADHAKLQVGFREAQYHWPAFAGDTFKKSFTVRKLRTTSDNHYSLLTVHCQLVNQRGVVCFTCEKTMLFPLSVAPSEVTISRPPASARQDFLEHLVKQGETLQECGSQTFTPLRAGQLVLHSLTRPLTLTHMMQLATLGRLTHERHFNTRQFRREEMLVPGGLVFALTSSLASRDLHEVLFEELQECSYPNQFAPHDILSAMSFIRSVDEHVTGDIEAVTLRTIGVKHVDVSKALALRDLPLSLFTAEMRPAQVEELCKKHCPELGKLVVCIADRKIFRQAPQQMPFLL